MTTWDARVGNGSGQLAASAIETLILNYADTVATPGFTVFRASGGDDSAALAALIASRPAGGATILCPDALYKIGTITLPASPKTITLVGAGIGSTTFKQNNASIGAATVTQFSVPAGATFRMRDMTLDGTTALSGAGIMRLVLGNAGTGGLIDAQRVRFTKYSYGLWTEDENLLCRDCIFDGGDSGNGMGGIYTNGILNGFTGVGRVVLDNCLFTDNGVIGTGQHHSTYYFSGIQVIATACKYTRLWGEGYHCHHNDDRGSGLSVGIESKYTDCYIGGAAAGGAANAFTVCKGSILTLKNCTVEAVDIPFFIEKDAKLNLLAGTQINGIATVGALNFEDTGIEVFADDCTFNTTATNYQFYLFSNDGKLTVKNSRFTGACLYDVQVLAAVTGCEVLLEGNVHTGATAGAVRCGAGARVHVERSRFLGAYSDAAIRNSAASTLAILNLVDNDFSQSSGTSVLLSATPSTLRVRGNSGTTGYKTEGGGVSTSTPGAVATVNIAHGLAQTPTILQVEPSNTNARGAPLYSVTADATNVILSFASNLTAATSYAWNWLARYQP